MADHPLSDVVRGFYNKLNVETNFVCRCNEEQLTEEQKGSFAQLSEEIKKRYYGSGLNFPENLKGKRILDIGCGSGSFVFLLSKLVGPTGYVVGFDLTEGLIKTAQEQSAYHCKQWGYDKPNFEFRVLNAEKLDEAGFSPGEFDIIVSNGVFCLVPDKERVFRAAFSLLKPGGQFYLNDVYAEKDPPEKYKNNETLWSLGTTGSMRWDTLCPVVTSIGFTTPYLTCAAPMRVEKEEYRKMLENARYSCAGWRLFKLDPKAAKKGASLVTYKGGITDYPDAFPWDVDLTFKKGEGVEVDAELATILSSIYLSDCFTFLPASGQPATRRNQSPFQLMDKLAAEGKLPGDIYEVK
ncbi:arsenite methyltransferase-like isoform X1 [Babylonia areolata]|uniref:arsenite methyltransferase-like isoform X1 n=1 Tax=Babylonia areolata TaxID=304850 RepID=UPI003FCF0086